MFVGTKRQAQESIVEQATRVGMPYVTERWLGGMLTNFQTVFKRLQRLKELELIESTGGQTVLTKKEALVLSRERIKLQRTLGGIRDMTRTPSAVWVVDTNKEHLAVNEARKLGIPVVAILDTNCDPDVVDYKIPGNDDAIRSIQVLTRVIADAVAEGLMARAGASSDADDKPEPGQLGGDEPLPEWEKELLTGSSAASEPPAAAGGSEPPAAEQADATAAPLESGAAAEAAGVDSATVEGVGAAEAPATEVEGAAADQPPAQQ
jgi:small subunit ribosomal protein S2